MNNFLSGGYRAVFTPTPQRVLISYYLDSRDSGDTPVLYGDIQSQTSLINSSVYQCLLTTPESEDVLEIRSHTNFWGKYWSFYGKNHKLIGKVIAKGKGNSILGEVQSEQWGKMGRIQYSNYDRRCVLTTDDRTFASIDFMNLNEYHFTLDGSLKHKNCPNLLFFGLSAVIYAIQNSGAIPFS